MREATAACPATVAERLLAFQRDPAHWSARYLQGHEPMPAGDVVISIALGRFPPNLPGVADAAARGTLQDAACAFLRQVCLSERATHYQALCAEPRARPGELRDHYRLLMALIHPDRQQESRPAWAEAGAQRVNRAYEILSDEHHRHAYDHRFRHSESESASSLAEGRGRHLRGAVVITGVAALLFMVQAAWVNDVPMRYSLVERAFSFDAPKRWVSSVVASAQPAAAEEAPPGIDAERLLQPLPPVVASVGSFPILEELPVLASAPPSPAAMPVSRVGIAPASPPPARPAPRAAPALRLAQLEGASNGQREAPSAALGAALAADDVEMLVALLVSYYEAGDVDRLMGLFDPDALGYWDGLRVRNAYSAFFRDTRQRKLQLHRLTWDLARQSARVAGSATVHAENAEGGGRIERASEVQLEIVLRDGQPRIARLSLYPEGA